MEPRVFAEEGQQPLHDPLAQIQTRRGLLAADLRSDGQVAQIGQSGGQLSRCPHQKLVRDRQQTYPSQHITDDRLVDAT